MSHTKKTPILWLILNKEVQFFEPYLKKSSILWVLKKSVLRVKVKRVQLFESCFCLKVIFSRRFILRIKFFSKRKFFASLFLKKKKFNFLRVIYQMGSIRSDVLKRGFNSLSHIFWKWFDFSSFSKSHFLYFFQQKFNFLSCVQKMGSILWVIFKKTFTSLSQYQKEKFNSLSHTGKQDRFNSLSHIEKHFNSLSHIEKRFIKKAQFYESFTKSSILWVIFLKKKISIFWVAFFDTRFNSLNHISEKEEVQFCKSYKNSSILWVLFRKNGSILWVKI